MPSLFEMGLSRTSAFIHDVTALFEATEQRIDPLRAELLDRGMILPIPSTDHSGTSQVTVDGGCVSQQLTSVDLIATCAVASEGVTGPKMYAPDEAPKLLWERILRDHDWKYANAGTKLMSLQEMILLEHETVKNHDLRIIDGSWTSAVIPVLMSLIQSPGESELINSLILDGIDKEYFTVTDVLTALTRRNKPWEHDDGTMVAIAKSDSQRSYAKILAQYGVNIDGIAGIADRTLASILLQPGEILTAVPLHKDFDSMDEEPVAEPFNPWHLSGYSQLSRDTTMQSHPHYQTLMDMYLELCNNEGIFSTRNHNNRLRSSSLFTFNTELWGWTTYFKPATFNTYSRPLKMDFIRPKDLDWFDLLANPQPVNNEAQRLADIISFDTTPEAKEPMSQYLADVEAKGISMYVKHLTNQLVEASNSPRLISGIMGTYRT